MALEAARQVRANALPMFLVLLCLLLAVAVRWWALRAHMHPRMQRQPAWPYPAH